VILTDIEGTISLVSFVFDVLTPELARICRCTPPAVP
jgi:methionine salvage enolase-phosphatase E1